MEDSVNPTNNVSGSAPLYNTLEQIPMVSSRGTAYVKTAQKELAGSRSFLYLLFHFFQDEAERLYKECKRYDLLNMFYQASNRWAKVNINQNATYLCSVLDHSLVSRVLHKAYCIKRNEKKQSEKSLGHTLSSLDFNRFDLFPYLYTL